MKIIASGLLFIAFVFGAFAQSDDEYPELRTPSSIFSHKKISYLTLLDGTEVEGKIDDIDRKKGLIEYIRLEMEDGSEVEYDADQIKSAYLPPSGLDDLNRASEGLTKVRKWHNDGGLREELVNDSYTVFELVEVEYRKGKTMKLLMQLVNPESSSKVRIYDDPYANETMGATYGGMQFTGGYKKSYFISFDEGKTAYRLKKKDYKDDFRTIWKDCQGRSSRGTLTTDTFSLSGSGAAYKKITEACGG